MLRPTIEDDVEELVAICEATGIFQPSELETVEEVFDEYFHNEYEKGHRSFTLMLDRGISGFIYIAPAPLTQGTWDLWWIVVHPETQGRGHGQAMLQSAETAIRKAGGRHVFLETSAAPSYAPTRRFYERHGFVEVARLPDFYATGEAKVIYRKPLCSLG